YVPDHLTIKILQFVRPPGGKFREFSGLGRHRSHREAATKSNLSGVSIACPGIHQKTRRVGMLNLTELIRCYVW
ncbi:MAG: hypothetical protein WBM55_09015, partial [Muriicola sp.]